MRVRLQIAPSHPTMDGISPIMPKNAARNRASRLIHGARPTETDGPGAQRAVTGSIPKYVFRTYVVGSANRFTHAASVSVAEHPGGKFNPLFIYGGVGSRQDASAARHRPPRARAARRSCKSLYVTSENFTNDLIAVDPASNGWTIFAPDTATTDILMIDDIQFIAGKESTQEEFFHTFNSLYQSGKQIIISSDKPPKSISALEDRLRSRFEGGLIADVQSPDYEMRIAILAHQGRRVEARPSSRRGGVHRPQGPEEYPRAGGRAQHGHRPVAIDWRTYDARH